MTNDLENNNTAIQFKKCFPVVPGTTYNFGAWVREPEGAAQGRITIAWKPSCNDFTSNTDSAYSQGKTTWHHVGGTSKAPAANRGGEIEIDVFGKGKTLQLDVVYLTPTPGRF